ncbi:MAG: type IV secretion system protein [Parvibaculum sp.]
MAFGLLDDRVSSLVALFESGPTIYLEPALSLFSKLAVLEIALFGILFAAGRSSNMADVVVRLMKLGTFFWFITEFPKWQGTILSGFTWGAQNMLVEGGSASLLPSTFIQHGFSAWSLVRKCSEGLSFWSGDGGTLIVLALVGVLLFLGMLWMGITGAMTILEYYLVTAIGFLLLPLSAFSPTAFIAEKPFSAFISLGVKAATVTLLSGLIITDLNGLLNGTSVCTSGGEVADRLRTVGLLLASAVFYLVLFIFAPRLAAGALTGTASLGAGAALGAAIGLAGATAGAAWGASKMGGAALKGGVAAFRGAHSAVNAGRAAAAGIGAAAKEGANMAGAGAGAMNRAAGAAGGVAAYGAQAAKDGISISAVGQHFKEQSAKAAAQRATATQNGRSAARSFKGIRQAADQIRRIDDDGGEK